jgi:hypothetical protein
MLNLALRLRDILCILETFLMIETKNLKEKVLHRKTYSIINRI